MADFPGITEISFASAPAGINERCREKLQPGRLGVTLTKGEIPVY